MTVAIFSLYALLLMIFTQNDLCSKLQMLYYSMRLTTFESLKSKTTKTENGCWEYNGYRDRDGYGLASFKNQNWQAHRLSYFFTHGTIPKMMCVCHTCDNRSCINPDHLWLGTHQDNMTDMKNKGRAPWAKK